MIISSLSFDQNWLNERLKQQCKSLLERGPPREQNTHETAAQLKALHHTWPATKKNIVRGNPTSIWFNTHGQFLVKVWIQTRIQDPFHATSWSYHYHNSNTAFTMIHLRSSKIMHSLKRRHCDKTRYILTIGPYIIQRYTSMPIKWYYQPTTPYIVETTSQTSDLQQVMWLICLTII